MKYFLSIVALLIFSAGVARADLAKDCFTTVDNTQFCTTDGLGKVQVFVFDAGWCPYCNQEMDDLAPLYASTYANNPNVIFASLSGEGYDNGSQPDVSFLQQWKSQHNITFVVAGKSEDFGQQFGAQDYIPFSVVVDQTGNITKSGDLSASDIQTEVNRLLGTTH